MALIVVVVLLPVVTGFNFPLRSLLNWMFPGGSDDEYGGATSVINSAPAVASVVSVLLVLLGLLLHTFIHWKEVPVARDSLNK